MRKLGAISLAALAFAACTDQPTDPSNVELPSFKKASGGGSYVIEFAADEVPAAATAAIQAAGGVVDATFEDMGVVVASSAQSEFQARASKIAGVVAVTPDIVVQWLDPNMPVVQEAIAETDISEESHQVGGHETFRLIQWAPDAIQAPAAWQSGALGAGARVAVLDGGIHNTHIDIAPNLDVARSASFVPGQPYNADGGTFWHGTHVAGIVAAPANNIGTVGIAPNATLIGVKVLHNGSGAFSWVLAAIYYAATPIAEGGAGAHIINMSLGAAFSKGGPVWAHLQSALKKATKFANSRGVTVIAAAGNSAIDLDAEKKVLFYPAQTKGNLGVSATGPLGFALGATNFDRLASYSNFGEAIVDLAGPGGDSALPGNAVCSYPRLPSGTGLQFCWVLDMVMAPCRGASTSISTYCWASGTSMASPAVAGVAALIVGKYPGISPAEVEARLRASADDRGAPGFDAIYGSGRVNAARAVE